MVLTTRHLEMLGINDAVILQSRSDEIELQRLWGGHHTATIEDKNIDAKNTEDLRFALTAGRNRL